MIPEIRRALEPIYNDLEDHPSVLDRLSIPGMGGVNSCFFTHKGRETMDIQVSKMNHQEAEIVVGFFDYLILNGLTPGGNHGSDLPQRTAKVHHEKTTGTPTHAMPRGNGMLAYMSIDLSPLRVVNCQKRCNRRLHCVQWRRRSYPDR